MLYTLSHALNELYPNSSWALSGENLNELDWRDESTPKPELQELQTWVDAQNAIEPMKLLRIERNKRLDECRWVIEKALTTDIPIPQAWKDYMQSLRDLPANSNPMLDSEGKLDMNSVNFPIQPSPIF